MKPTRIVTDAELESAVAYCGYLVLRYGEAVLPIFDRLESELEQRRRVRSPLDRARAAMQRYTVTAVSIETLKAMR